jgi:thiamine-monophosphate kinase
LKPGRMKPGPEFDRIRAFIAAVRAASPSVEIPPGDDASVIRWPSDQSVVLSSDAFVEGVHFKRAWLRWEAVGYRATAGALSDLAAMAARPVGVLISLMVPPETEESMLVALGEGVGECLRQHETGLLGGDLAHSPSLVAIDVCAVGSSRSPISRGGASEGDEIWLTGAVGGAAKAVQAWGRSMEPDPRARAAFERPTARIAEAIWLAEHADLTALIDLSDGLAGDARQIAAASEARLRIDLDAVPLAPPLSEYVTREAALGLALAGGEDYELLMCSVEGSLETVRAEFERRFEIRLTKVGAVEEGEGVAWTSASGASVPAGLDGFDHFAPGRTG